MGETNVLDAVLEVFTRIGSWISTSVQSLIPMFYAEGQLTFIGVLACAGLGISVILLIINMIKGFLSFQ